MPAADRGEGLFVAGRGSSPSDGLHHWVLSDAHWRGRLLAPVADLAALAMHPSLAVVYGVSGVGPGRIHAWDVSGGGARLLAEIASGGDEPCHVAVDPTGRMLVVANYTSGSLAVVGLSADGAFVGDLQLLSPDGRSVDPDRQSRSHPHQSVFVGDHLLVVDLGADRVLEFSVDLGAEASDPTAGGIALTLVSASAVPPGTGPRHLVALPGGKVAITGELAATILVGKLRGGADGWAVAASTTKTGPAGTRTPRNYPGDITSSADGTLVYLANRGYDTVAAVRVGATNPELAIERDAGVGWPQHLLRWGNELLVAGSDSSCVTALPLVDGIPGEARMLFACAGASWMLADGGRTHR
ncbi:MAG: hypothetical protein JWQ68_559 [Cryobacterium sp.]|nr:hypothetical protein [Cryobacterium sp.]